MEEKRRKRRELYATIVFASGLIGGMIGTFIAVLFLSGPVWGSTIGVLVGFGSAILYCLALAIRDLEELERQVEVLAQANVEMLAAAFK